MKFQSTLLTVNNGLTKRPKGVGMALMKGNFSFYDGRWFIFPNGKIDRSVYFLVSCGRI